MEKFKDSKDKPLIVNMDIDDAKILVEKLKMPLKMSLKMPFLFQPK